MSEADDFPLAPVLSRVPLPTPDEHASGYLRRLAEENGLLLSDLRNLIGIRMIGPRSAPETWLRLAEGLGVPAKTFDPLRWRPINSSSNRWVAFLGHEIHDSFLHQRSPQLCTLCLASRGIIRQAWALRHLTACAEHQIQLSNLCARCGQSNALTRSYAAWTCRGCGSDWRMNPAKPAAQDEIAIAEWIESRLATSHSPRTVEASEISLNPNQASLHEMLTTLVYLGRLRRLQCTDEPAARVRPHNFPLHADRAETSDQIREQNKLALELLTDWPSSYNSLLRQLIDQAPVDPGAPPLLHRFGTKAGIFAVRPLKNRSSEPLPFVTTTRLEFLSGEIGYRPRGRTPKRSALNRTPVEQSAHLSLLSDEATRRALYGNTRNSLSTLIKAGHLTPRRTPNGGVGFALAEVQTLVTAAANLPIVAGEAADLMALPACISRLAKFRGGYANLIDSILTGEIEAFSSDGSFGGIRVFAPDFLDAQATTALRYWIGHRQYKCLQKINRYTTRLWGTMGRYSIPEANQLVAGGKLRFQRVQHKQRGDPRIYHVGDIVRYIQSWIGPFLIDVDAIESKLPPLD